MKAEMGSMRKAMIRSGISFDIPPNEQKPRISDLFCQRKPEEQLRWNSQEEEQAGQGCPTLRQKKRRKMFLILMKITSLSLEALLQ